MLAYIVRRAALGVLTMVAVSILSFIIIQLPPGDYVTTYITQLEMSGTQISQQQADALRNQYGLDKPVYIQYLKWMSMVVRGEFGMAMAWSRPVADLIGERMVLTVVVSLAAVLLTWAIALPIGIFSAVKRYSLADYAFTILGFIGLSVPGFMLALVLMYLGYRYFNADIGGLFSSEYVQAPWSWARFYDMLKHLPLPALILGLSGTAHTIRIMRANLLDELRKPYVVTARSKGLSEIKVILKYPVRVALNPFASTVGYLLPYIVSGSVIVSMVLSLPTVGPLLLRALLGQDMFLAGTIVLMLGFMTVVGTFLSDLLLMWIDPRIRVEGRQ